MTLIMIIIMISGSANNAALYHSTTICAPSRQKLLLISDVLRTLMTHDAARELGSAAAVLALPITHVTL